MLFNPLKTICAFNVSWQRDVYWRALCKKVFHLSPKRVARYKVTLDFLFSYVHMLVYMCDNHDKSSSQNYIPTF